MGLLAERLGVKTPSLYKHVDSLADLIHRIAVLAAIELGDALREATQGRAGTDALTAAAQAMRTYVKNHPGRYAAGNSVRPGGPGDPLTTATNRMLDSFSAVLRGYQLDPDQQIHALRTLRSMLHGFTTIELEGGFRFDTDVDGSFTWMVNLIDHGLRAADPEIPLLRSGPNNLIRTSRVSLTGVGDQPNCADRVAVSVPVHAPLEWPIRAVDTKPLDLPGA